MRHLHRPPAPAKGPTPPPPTLSKPSSPPPLGVAFPPPCRWLPPMPNRVLTCVVSVSGIRGIVGSSFDIDQAMGLAAAYGRSLAAGGTVVLGRDSRPTGELFAQAVAAGLRGVGCAVVEIGVVPTPTVPIMIGHLGAAGGIQLSPSHNPGECNPLNSFTPALPNIHQT